jgi:hypothetical protein
VRLWRRTAPRLLPALAGVPCALAVFAAVPTLATASPWRLESAAAPTYLPPGGEARIIAVAANLSSSPIDADNGRVTLTDKLPAGLQILAGVEAGAIEAKLEARHPLPSETLLQCAIEEPGRREVSCQTTTATAPIDPYQELKITIPVKILAGASSTEQNTVSLTGGETGGNAAPPAALAAPLTVSSESTPFGVEHLSLTPENEDLSIDTQSGSHPYQLTTTLNLNQTLALEPANGQLQPASPALFKNVGLQLPPGLLGNIKAVEQCSDLEFSTFGHEAINGCPANTVLGVASVTLNLPRPLEETLTELVPVFNLAPAPGEPARFGFEVERVPVILDTSVRTDGDYGVNVTLHNATQTGQILSTRVTLWGEPDNPAHAASRGWNCLLPQETDPEPCPATTRPGERTTPFLTLPTSCAGNLTTTVTAEAWTGQTAQDSYTFQNGLGEPLASLEDCPVLPFNPAIAVQPVEEHEGGAPEASQTTASTPTGLNVEVSLPTEAGGLGESATRQATVTLPQGLELSPSAANGLQACSETQAGFEGGQAETDPFSPGAPEPLRFSSATASCPSASKVGLARIKSPDLAHELTGGVYLAEPAPNGEAGKNPFDSLIALYLIAEDPASGVRVKLAGDGIINETNAQIQSTFTDTPQVPLERLRLHFFEGPHASLTTPALCGTYTTTSSFTPWSGTPSAEPSSSFQITGGPEGRACTDPLSFAPGLSAGSSNPQAGAFTSFSLTLTNPDTDQRLRALSVHLPPGIAAILASVTPCPEPQAAQEQCGPESLIGHSLAGAGLGPEPYELPGNVYLTGPYEGAPFGIEVVTPAVAGPFDLGNVTVRSRIEVNPHTAAVTISSDAIPLRVKGVPSQIKWLTVTVDRAGFEFNPTSCDPGPVTATLTGYQGATSTGSYPFNTSNCTSLPFKPVVSASTLGKTSKANGASLALAFKSESGEAHVARTILTIPATLPARLSTIQKACLARIFEANPATCPEGSDIGTAVVHTPVLKNPVAGPIYLVSHGNAAWPDAELVLQGEGITVILDGQTAIKKGVTTSSFLSVPDVPFETVEANLPEGPHSALTMNSSLAEKAHYDLCGQHLSIPTQLTGQNGTLVNDSVKVAVQGCGAVKASKARKLTRAQKLAVALKACRKRYMHSRAGRSKCERQARQRYGPRRGARKRSHVELASAGRSASCRRGALPWAFASTSTPSRSRSRWARTVDLRTGDGVERQLADRAESYESYSSATTTIPDGAWIRDGVACAAASTWMRGGGGSRSS